MDSSIMTPCRTEKVDFSIFFFLNKNRNKNRITKKTNRQEETEKKQEKNKKKIKTAENAGFDFFLFFFCFFLFFLVFGFLVCFFCLLCFFYFYYFFVKPYILCVVGLITLVDTQPDDALGQYELRCFTCVLASLYPRIRLSSPDLCLNLLNLPELVLSVIFCPNCIQSDICLQSEIVAQKIAYRLYVYNIIYREYTPNIGYHLVF